MGKDLTKTQMALGEVEARVAKVEAWAQAIEEVLNEAKNQIIVIKEEVWDVEVGAPWTIAEAVKSFKTRREYHQMVLDSFKKAFW